MPLIQIFIVGVSGNTTVHEIEKEAPIEKLFQSASDRFNLPTEEIRLVFAGKELQTKDPNGKIQYLHTYALTEKSTCFMTMRLKGGNDVEDGQRIGRFLRSKPKQTQDSDIISGEDDPAHPRGLMPCGHAIGPCSLFLHLRTEVYTKARHEIKCPLCPEIWDYPTVRLYAALTDEEKKDFETRLARNYIQKFFKAQQCPKCKTYCERIQRNNPRVVCSICSKSGGRYEFCWYCLSEWKSGNSTDCGNNACSGSGRLHLLNNCGTKEIIGVPNCPRKRACPWCYTLIEHDHACKQMHCKACAKEFCFICLSKRIDGKWSCGGSYTKCAVAPIQQTLE